MRYLAGKRNKPDVITISSLDDAKYGDWINKFIRSKTSSRKHFKNELKFYGGNFIIGKVLVPITTVEKYTDGIKLLAEIYTSEDTDVDIEYFSFSDLEAQAKFSTKFPRMLIVKSGKKNYSLVSRNTVPRNARLVSISPPVWVQFCPGAILYTPGLLWCNERLKEYDDDIFTFENLGDKWLIRVSAGVYSSTVSTEEISGLYYMDRERLWKAGEQPSRSDIFLDKNTIIKIEGDEYVEYSRRYDEEVFRVKRSLVEEFGKISTGKRTIYAPRFYLENGVMLLVG